MTVGGKCCALVVLACLAAAAMPADPLVVDGDGFRFSVKVPEGWRGDVAGASGHHANVVFSRPGEDVVIRVSVATKANEQIATLLATDTDTYRKDHPGTQCGELTIDHPYYATYSKLCFAPRQLYDYVSYVNAGQEVPYLFMVRMSVAKRPANENERTALDAVVRSLRAVTSAR